MNFPIVRCYPPPLGLMLVTLLAISQPVHAADTYICNKSNETLYAAVRDHDGLRLLGDANAKTEGWFIVKRKTSLLVPCATFSRSRVTQIFVLGVMRGNEIVPVDVDIERPDRREKLEVCVTTKKRDFGYKSNRLSDTSCKAGFRLASSSFGLRGGDNDVYMNISGDYSSVRAGSGDERTSYYDTYSQLELDGLIVKNSCAKPIRVIIRYLEPQYREWRFTDYLNLRPGEQKWTTPSIYVLAPRVSWRAETTDDSGLVWEGDHEVTSESTGETYSMRVHTWNKGKEGKDHVMTVACNNLP